LWLDSTPPEAQKKFIKEFRKRNTHEEAKILNFNLVLSIRAGTRNVKSQILFDRNTPKVRIKSEVNQALMKSAF